MFKISNEKELLECFRPLERAEVTLPQELKFPVLVRDYLTWSEPSGVRQYIVFNEHLTDPPLGVVFRRDQSAGGAAAMCEFCHSIRSGGSVGLLTATASSNRRVGLHLCLDLSCKEKADSLPGVHDLPAQMSPEQRLRTIIGRIAQFVRRELF